MGFINKLFGHPNPELQGMVRVPDHPTSEAAAIAVSSRRITLRERVLRYALESGSFGFIDENLAEIDPARPESSLRKRRTELAEKNWVLDAGYTRRNSHGQQSTVWVHRDFRLDAPPLQSKAKVRRLSGEEMQAKIVEFLRTPEHCTSTGGFLAARIAVGEHLK